MTNDQPSAEATIGPVAVVLRQCRHGFILMVGLCVIIELLSLAPMVYMWNTFDRVMTSRSVVTLLSLTVLIVGVYLFSSAMEWARSRLMVRLSLRIDWDLAADVFDAAFRRQAHRKAVNVQQAMGDLLTLRQFLSGKGVLTVIAAPFALLFIAAGATFNPALALFSLGTALVMLVAAKVNQQMTSSALKASNTANHEATRMAAGLLRHSETTRALGMMPALRQRWYAQHREFVALQVQASDVAGSGAGMTSFMQHSFQSLGMALGIFLAIEGLITGGMVMAASMLINKSVSPLQQLIATWPSIVQARQAYDRLNQLLADDVRPADAMSLPPPVGQLVVANASGAPQGAKRAAVQGVSFELKAGQALAIVGPSAAGKTSLSKLLVGAWQPIEGSIRLDGVEISDWNPDELGPLIGYVPQEIEFFEGSVAENIARLATVDAGAVVAAARAVGMHETILQWPEGYDTQLGESGFALSGGQRQRLAIARALYGNPRYVVMDEPNANLDEVGEQALIESMRHLRTLGTTVIVTTHRPRLIGIVDLMLVLKGGRQVGFGPPKDLFEAVKRVQPSPVAVPPAVAASAQPAPQPQAGSAA
jgi:PrtD family type I secretion system ABC transporter